MHFIQNWLALFISIIALAASSVHGEQSVDLRFAFTAPEGFSPAPKILAADQDALFAYRKSDLIGQPTLVAIERLHERIGYRRMTAQDVFQGAKLTKMTWNGVEVDGYEKTDFDDGVELLDLVVLLPLESEGIRITIAGPKSREATLRSIQTGLIASVRGESDRFNSIFPPAISNSIWYYPFGTSAFMLVTLVGSTYIWWKVRHRLKRGLWIVLPLSLVVIGGSIPVTQTREARTARALITIIGVIGCVTGVIGKLRPKRERALQPPPTAPIASGA